MADLATCMRRVARVLWAVHVTFQEARPCLFLPPYHAPLRCAPIGRHCWRDVLLEGRHFKDAGQEEADGHPF